MRRRFRNTIDDVWEWVHRQPEGCWEWQGARARGYGRMGIGGKVLQTSRLAYISVYGSIPEDIFVCHTCDNRACCRPSHLFLGTCADNVQDMWEKNRGALRTGDHRGTTKLTRQDVQDIRAMHIPYGMQKKIAEQYGVNPCTISNIRHNKLWKADLHELQ